jgi:hypothetical protein
MYYLIIFICLLLVVGFIFWWSYRQQQQQLVSHQDNIDFLMRETGLESDIVNPIYRFASRYIKSEIPIVETSLQADRGAQKSPVRGRFSIPILYRDIRNHIEQFTRELSQLICGSEQLLQRNLAQFIEQHITTDPVEKNMCDIIIGYDDNKRLYKLYVDNNHGHIECLRMYKEGGNYFLQTKNYRRLNRRQVNHLTGRWASIVYYSGDGSYHIGLRRPVRQGTRYLHMIAYQPNSRKITHYYRLR